MNSPRKILYFYTNWSSFVEKDIYILQKRFTLIIHEFKPSKKIFTPFSFVKQALFILKNYQKPCAFVIQFSGYHAFLPCFFSKILRAPSLIIAGGTDCVAFPSISYGNLRKNLLGTFTRWSYHLASHISPVDDSLILCKYYYQQNDFPNQGIKAFIPNLKVPITVIHNGYDNSFHPIENIEKELKTFITVAAGIEKKSRFDLKGMDMIFQLAKKIPEASFLLIGSSEVPEQVPANVSIIPFVANAELIKQYNKATFYLQLSMSEGFPNSLAEAMQCGCVPIVSAVGAMPLMIQNYGFILHRKNINDLVLLVNQAMNADVKMLAKACSVRINDNFPLQKREQKLLQLMEEQF